MAWVRALDMVFLTAWIELIGDSVVDVVVVVWIGIDVVSRVVKL